jgi:hypothetical protein
LLTMNRRRRHHHRVRHHFVSYHSRFGFLARFDSSPVREFFTSPCSRVVLGVRASRRRVSRRRRVARIGSSSSVFVIKRRFIAPWDVPRDALIRP